jgi:lysyl-tRNA synthetase class 2
MNTNTETYLDFTKENIDKVLDEIRPYLIQDGGNVAIVDIDKTTRSITLSLQGACGSCPSSSMTMKMGLERRLKERIPEIAEVVQTIPDAPALTNENIETVLDGVRPFLSVAGGKISIQSLTGVGGLQPVITLKMDGTAASLQSVKIEIMQRIQRHFMTSLKIDWV